jgi:DNA modification methylase
MININKVYNLDCEQGMRLLEDDSVDITITSPPYNIGGKYALYKDNLSEEEYTKFIRRVIKEMIRVTKYYVFFNYALLTNNKNTYLQLMSEFKENIKEIIIWHKRQAIPTDITCLSSAFEFIIVFSKKEESESRLFSRSYMKQISTNVIHGNSNSVDEFNDGKVNNTACFPQYLVKWIIDKFSKEGDIIMDPFMGSGTTAYVTKQNNRQYLGFEIDKSQVDLTEIKLRQLTVTPNFVDNTNWFNDTDNQENRIDTEESIILSEEEKKVNILDEVNDGA